MKDIQLLYASTVADNFDPADLDDILTAARERNTREGITGVLFFTPQYFVQCLEGNRGAVNRLYSDLMSDPRHNDLILLSYKEIEERMFASWKMAYIGPGGISEEILNSHSMGKDFNPAATDESMANAMLQLLVRDIHK